MKIFVQPPRPLPPALPLRWEERRLAPRLQRYPHAEQRVRPQPTLHQLEPLPLTRGHHHLGTGLGYA